MRALAETPEGTGSGKLQEFLRARRLELPTLSRGEVETIIEFGAFAIADHEDLPLTLEYAQVLLAAERYRQALARINDAISRDPDNLDAVAIRVAALRKLGWFSLALEACQKEAQLNRSNPALLAERCALLFVQRDYARAIQVLAQAGESWEAVWEQAIRQEVRDPEELLREALARFPEARRLQLRLARTLMEADAHGAALQWFERVLVADGANEEAHTGRIEALRRLARLEDAERAADEAHRRLPSSRSVLAERAEVYFGQGRFDDAARAAVAADSDPLTMWSRARGRGADDDGEERTSRSHVLEVILAQLSLPAVKRWLADHRWWLAYDDDDRKALAQLLVAALERYPNDRELLIDRAGLLLDTGQEDEAIAIFETLVAERPTDEEAWVGLLIALRKLQRVEKAFEVAEKARKALPAAPSVALQYAVLLETAERWSDAIPVVTEFGSADDITEFARRYESVHKPADPSLTSTLLTAALSRLSKAGLIDTTLAPGERGLAWQDMIAAAAKARFPASPGLLSAAAAMISREGRQSESIELYRRACSLDPLSEETWLDLIRLLESGQATETGEASQEALAQLGPTLNLVLELSRLLVRASAQELLLHAPPDFSPEMRLAMWIAARTEDGADPEVLRPLLDNALREISTQALECFVAEVLPKLSVSDTQQERVELLEAAEARFPLSSRIKEECAELHLTLQHHWPALTRYERVLVANPRNSLARSRKIAILRALGRQQEAGRDVPSDIDSSLRYDTTYQLECGRLYVDLGSYDAAAGLLVTAGQPQTRQAITGLPTKASKMGLCEAVQRLRPNDPEIGFTLGDLYLSHVKTHLFRPHLAVPAYDTALRFGDATARALAGKVACFRPSPSQPMILDISG